MTPGDMRRAAALAAPGDEICGAVEFVGPHRTAWPGIYACRQLSNFDSSLPQYKLGRKSIAASLSFEARGRT